MSLQEFFPLYPEIKEKGFEEKLNSKLEFLELVPDQENAKRGDILLNNNFYLHQEEIRRYLQPFTGYERVLLNHQVGVGKTRSVLAVTENYLSNYNMRTAYIFAKNNTVIDNFKNELFGRMKLYRTKEDLDYAKMTTKGVSISRTRSIGNKYSFETFEVFVRKEDIKALGIIQNKISLLIAKGSSVKDAEKTLTEGEKIILEKIREEYSNSVIAIDEVHNIGVTEFEPLKKSDEKERKKDESHYQYRRFWSFLMTVTNCVVILLSATPMVDSALKIVSIVNLIAPREQQISFTEAKKVIKSLDQNKITKFFTPFFKGKVSFLKQSGRVAKQEYMGKDIHFDMDGVKLTSRLSIDVMKPTQALAYKHVVDSKEGDENVFHHDLRQVSNFALYVHPDFKHVFKTKDKDTANQDEDDFGEVEEGFDVNIKVEKIKTDDLEEQFQYVSQAQLSKVMSQDKKKDMDFLPAYESYYSNQKEMRYKSFMDISKVKDQSVLFYFLCYFFSEEADIRKYKKDKENSKDLHATEKAYVLISLLEEENKLIKKYKNKIDPEEQKFRDKFDKLKKQHKYVMRPDLAIKNINKSSSKIADALYGILTNLTKDKDEQECVFVYSHYKSYGAFLVGAFLKMFGFERYTGKGLKKEEGKDVAKLPDSKSSLDTNSPFRFSTITEAKDAVENIVEVFNHPDNKNGNYLKIIVGSPKSSESISFMNVRRIDILEPGWNDQDTIQAIGRGVRSNSHLMFPPSQRYVKIYIHVAMIETGGKLEMNMIDMNASRISAEKAYKINLIQESIKECSFDKNLNAWRNGIKEEEVDQIDFSTYKVYYKREFVDFIMKKIQPLFYKKNSYLLEEIVNLIGVEKYDILYVMESLEQYTIQDKFGIQNYIQYDGKYLFLLPYKVSNDELLYYYSDVLNIQIESDTNSYIESKNLAGPMIKKSLKDLEKQKESNIVEYLRDKNLMPFRVKIYMLEEILSSGNQTKMQKLFLDYFKYRWFLIEHEGRYKAIHTLYFVPETHHFSCSNYKFVAGERKLRVLDGIWRFASSQEEDEIIPIINENLKEVAEKYKKQEYYGVICTTDGEFRFIDNKYEDNKKPTDCRNHKRGVAFASVLKECIIEVLYNIWDDLLSYFPRYKDIPKKKQEFITYMTKNYKNNDLSHIYEEYFKAKDILWLY